jgi:hypothetical protein
VEEHAAVGDDSVGLVEAAVEEEEEEDEEEEVFHPGDTSGLLRRFDSAVSAIMEEAEPGGVDDYITPMTNRPQVRNPKVVLFFVVGPHTTRGRCLGRHLRLHGWRSTSLAVGFMIRVQVSAGRVRGPWLLLLLSSDWRRGGWAGLGVCTGRR